jgi:folate-binding protein YgfZ
MNSATYTINDRTLTSFSPLEEELTFDPHQNYLFDLSYLSVLQVQGEQAQTFLQGQVSCDMHEVTTQQFQQGALCNLKGRVLSLMDILHTEMNGYQLILPHDLMLKTKASLDKTALLSRVKLTPNTDYRVFGLYIQNPEVNLFPTIQYPTHDYGVVTKRFYSCYFLGKGLYTLMIEKSAAEDLCREYKSHQLIRGSLAWHALTLQRKKIEIYPSSRGLFLPHRLDLHKTGYLSFNKGCYKGQEIIARTHYRATLKHEMRCFTVQTHEPIHAGQRLLHPGSNIEVGELIDYCPLTANHYLIAASVLFEHPLELCLEHHKESVTLVPFTYEE